MGARDRQWIERLVWLVAGIATLVALLALGYLAVHNAIAAAAIAVALLGIALTAMVPSAIPLGCLPVLFVVLRVGGGGVDLSASDFVLALAAVPATILAPRPLARELRAVLWALAAYQFATLLTVVNNPYTANIVEWFHSGVMVGGALMIGWMIGVSGHGRLGMRLILVTTLVLALLTIGHGVIQYGQGNFDAVYIEWPYSMHKNFIGTVCALGAVIAYARPTWVGLSRWAAWGSMSLLSAAVLLSQSRQAVIGLVAAIAVLVFRSKTERKRSKLIILLLIPVIALVTNLVQDQIATGDRFNSLFQRITWFQDSLNVWSTDPIFGVGLRWWYTDRFAVNFQPPNAEIEVLTASGIVGLVAFLVFVFVTLRTAGKLDPVYGSVALGVLVNRYVAAQFDLFWAAVQGSVPFVVLAICIGAAARSRREVEATALPVKAAQRPSEVSRS